MIIHAFGLGKMCCAPPSFIAGSCWIRAKRSTFPGFQSKLTAANLGRSGLGKACFQDFVVHVHQIWSGCYLQPKNHINPHEMAEGSAVEGLRQPGDGSKFGKTDFHPRDSHLIESDLRFWCGSGGVMATQPTQPCVMHLLRGNTTRKNVTREIARGREKGRITDHLPKNQTPRDNCGKASVPRVNAQVAWRRTGDDRGRRGLKGCGHMGSQVCLAPGGLVQIWAMPWNSRT